MPSAARINIHHNDRTAQFNGGGGTALRSQQNFGAQSHIRSVNVTTSDVATTGDHHKCTPMPVPREINQVAISSNGLELFP